MNLDQFTAENAPTESAEPFQRENSSAVTGAVGAVVDAALEPR